MSLRQFVLDTVFRYRTKPFGQATRRTAKALQYGAKRRVGPIIGDAIWEYDWDLLVVLDGCRYDLWDEVAPEYGLATGQTITSNASCSIDWLNRNFNAYPEEASRTGYVTANPFADHDTDSAKSADLESGPVGYFRPLYKTHWTDLCDGQIATVPPRTVTDHAIRTWRERHALDIDQLVVHYMQPHEPYRARPEWGSGDSKLLENLIDESSAAGSSVWPRVEHGDISREEFWSVYKDNLRWALDDVADRLLENVDGEVVLTADHGNALGEWGEWHHPPGAISPGVRRVPWVSVECEDQKTVAPDATLGHGDELAEETTDQLRELGYM